MTLQGYLRTLRQGLPIVLLCTLLGLLGGLASSLRQHPSYQSEVSLYVSTVRADSPSDLNEGSAYVQNQMTSYSALANSPMVLAPVIDKLHLPGRVSDLAGNVSGAAAMGSSILTVKVTQPTPAGAQKVAAAVADQLVDTLERVTPQTGQGGRNVKVRIVSPASTPPAPGTMARALPVGLGLVAGLIIGLLVVVLLRTLDSRLRSPQDVTAVGPETLATLPSLRLRHGDALAFDLVLPAPYVEAMRRLRTALAGRKGVGVAQLVCSPDRGDGKSLVSFQLAKSSARSGLRVLLVDADLSGTGLSAALGVGAAPGLSDLLTSRIQMEDCVHHLDPRLDIIPRGTIDEVSTLLDSPHLAGMLAEASTVYDRILIDTSNMAESADAAVLARVVPQVLLVARSGHTTSDSLAACCRILEAAGAQVSGVVLNRTR